MNVIDALLIEDMQNDTFEQSNEGTREQAVGGGREVLESSETRQESNNTGRSGNSEKSTEKSSKTGRQVLEEVLQGSNLFPDSMGLRLSTRAKL